MKQLGCTGMQDLLALIEENKSASKIFILCSGETDEAGQSWCPDCVKGDFLRTVRSSLGPLHQHFCNACQKSSKNNNLNHL